MPLPRPDLQSPAPRPHGASEDYGAFVAHGRVRIAGAPVGPLTGLDFAVKDIFDLAGVPTGMGSPDWLASHEVPQTTAPVVQHLLDAGADIVGKTKMDELAWSLTGENAHYGTPENPAAPGRVPGGSSSGSVVAAAGGLAAFALGTDTGGSVRLPASYCGVIGLRATYGRLPLTGAVPLAPSYDSAGWFARDAEIFARVGRVLLGEDGAAGRPGRVLIAADLFSMIEPRAAEALAEGIARIEAVAGPARAVDLGRGELGRWRETFHTVQAAEAWETHGDWVTRTRPDFGPGVRERFAAAARLDPADVADARAFRDEIRTQLRNLLGQDAVLILPSAPGIAPLCGTPPAALENFRARALELLCPAGHAGLPQISLPLAMMDGCPLGLSVMAGADGDAMLVDLARAVMG